MEDPAPYKDLQEIFHVPSPSNSGVIAMYRVPKRLTISVAPNLKHGSLLSTFLLLLGESRPCILLSRVRAGIQESDISHFGALGPSHAHWEPCRRETLDFVESAS